jgi:hypothetical protein
MMRLIDLNISALMQANKIVSELDNRTYVQPAPGANGLRIGAHLRHVIEFYECFLQGIRDGLIDYDARRRDSVIETDRLAAIARLREIARDLHELASEVSFNRCCLVRAEDAGFDEEPVSSTAGRELQALFSHTTHHFALIAIALHAIGIPFDPGFGVAPSTLRYRARRTKAA